MSPVSLPPAHVVAAAPTVANTQVAGWGPYVVRSGDTLWDLAGRFRVSVGDLVSHNGLASAGSVLHVGDRLSVPNGTTDAAPAAAAASGSAAPVALVAAVVSADRGSTYGTYVVRAGDTPWGIASSLRVDVFALLTANGLGVHDMLMPGQRLTLPGGQAAARAAAKASRTRAADTGPTTVTVAAGDSLWDIASRYGVSVTSLAKANGRSLDGTLLPGDRLRVVGSVAPSAAAPSQSTPLSNAAAANLAYLNAVHTPSRTELRSMIVATAQAHGVDPRLALAIAWQESRWSHNAVSEVNAVGVMQCLPSTGGWVSTLVGRTLNLLDPQDNITCGVALLRSLTRSASSESEAIGAYYQGLASVRQRGFYQDTKDYVAAVLAYKSRM